MSTQTETNCGACGLYFDKSQADESGFHSAKFCDQAETKNLENLLKFAQDHRNDQAEYPTSDEMFLELEKTVPEGWIVSDEYHFIGVNHPALTDEQFISFGNVNGCFGFNDTNADTVCGDMENIYEPAEIAKDFWFQLSEFYPALFGGN